MSKLQLVFKCRPFDGPASTGAGGVCQIVSNACEEAGLGGYFVPSSSGYVGLFEGDHMRVIEQVEKLIQAKLVAQIEVVSEQAVLTSDWSDWLVDGGNALVADQSGRACQLWAH